MPPSHTAVGDDSRDRPQVPRGSCCSSSCHYPLLKLPLHDVTQCAIPWSDGLVSSEDGLEDRLGGWEETWVHAGSKTFIKEMATF